MMRRPLNASLATFLVLGLSTTFALAQDERALAGKGSADVEFAQALANNGYPDLAEKLLTVISKKGGGSGAESQAQIEKIHLDVSQADATKIDDLAKRKDALVKVLADMVKFIETRKGTTAAEDVRNALPDLYSTIGETFAALIKKEKDEKVLEGLRAEGDALFQQAEAAAKARMEDLKKAIDPNNPPAPDSEETNRMEAAHYNFCRTLYLHALLFAPGSTQRTTLATTALKEYEEFDLEYSETLLNYYAFVDMGLCLKELGQIDQAASSMDQTIRLKDGDWPKEKTGLVELPSDVANIVCYAYVQKMILFEDAKRLPDVVKTGEDYFACIAKPFAPPNSMALAKKLAEAMLGTNDTAGATKVAKRMKEEDPAGLGNLWASEILDRSGGGGATWQDRINGAAQKLQAGETQAALAAIRAIIYDVSGTPDEVEAAYQGWLLIGYSFQKRNWFEEAAYAYELAATKYSKNKNAAEACASAIDMYRTCMQVSRRQYYKDKIKELTDLIKRTWPTHPVATQQQLNDALGFEGDNDWQNAIESYKKLPSTSTVYPKARARMGVAYYNWIVKLFAEKKPDEAKKIVPDAEAALKDALKIIADVRSKTLEAAATKDLDANEYLANLTMAMLLMIPDLSRESEALPYVETLEAKWSGDASKATQIQNLRGRLYLGQGKFKEYAEWIDKLLKTDPKSAAYPASNLAVEYDRQGADEASKGNIAKRDELWRQAEKYYYLSVKPQLEGKATPSADELTQVGNRFYAYGLILNNVPAERETFIDWEPSAKTTPEFWQKAVEIYTAALQQSPDYRMTIKLGRALGFLGKYVESAAVYQGLFDREQILGKGGRIDNAVITAKPELVYAYLEWGVAEQLAAAEDKDKSRYVRCANIFNVMLATARPDAQNSFPYWAAKYHQIKMLMDMGDYSQADVTVRGVQRDVDPQFDKGKYGYQKRFEKIDAELDEKLPGRKSNNPPKNNNAPPANAK